MKDCEIYSNLRVPCGSRIMIRIDGRKFSNLSRILRLEKPYDLDFVKTMAASCLDFFTEFSPSFIYTFSDEINILLDTIPFSGRVEKLNSVFASFIAGSFVRQINQVNKFRKNLKDSGKFKSVSFDSRIIPLNTGGVIEYLKSRQDEAWSNCLNGYAYWTLRKEHDKEETARILDRKKKQELHELLFQNDLNIIDFPAWQRRGLAIYRESIIVDGYNPLKDEKVTSKRFKPFIDWDLPVFNDEFFVLKNILNV
jgi:tRNA(His) guanylyltransferase